MELTSNEVVKDLRIVLLGKTGAGKSATGNTILGREAFAAEMSPTSVTKTCRKETVESEDGTISVIDTPGLFDTSGKWEELKCEIENCIMMSLPGPHIFLLVISLASRFTEEEKKAAQWITENFSEESSKYTLVVFTRGDELRGMTIEQYLGRNADLRKLTDECKAGYVVFDNTCRKTRQVVDLLEKIVMTVHLNGGHYTSSIFNEAQRKLWWRNMGTKISSVSPLVFGVVASAAAPTLTAAAKALVFSRPVLMLGSAVFGTAVGWWTRSTTDQKRKDN